jgi:AraC family transcriptional regulator of adaptative response/methylated-DNA-[protein]-cysteine methyltransferase
MIRISSAMTKLKDGENITNVAFDSGYASLSGFNESFKTLTGISPSKATSKNIINIHRFESPLGPMFACATDEGLCLLEFSERRWLDKELKTISQLLDASIIHGMNDHLQQVENQMNEYFRKERTEFTIPLVTPGTEFQQKVWKELQNIPYGSTRSYKEQSIALGQPSAIRAVANANGMNRIAVIIPCHRVIGEDGHLTGYGGGIWRKKWLLDLERGIDTTSKSAQQEIVFNG